MTPLPGGAVDPVAEPVWRSADGVSVALTFDDGPNGPATERLLDVLAEHGLPAVFCVIGECIQAPGGAALLRRIVAEGHVLCNHSTSFDDLGSLPEGQVRQVLVENLAMIRDALGDPLAPVPYFRAPNGSWGVTAKVAVELGMQPLAVVNTIDDWREGERAVLLRNLRAAMKKGEVLLVHDGGGDRDNGVSALTQVLGERLAEGWTFGLPADR